MREIGISPRFSRDKFVPLQMKQRYSTRDISGKVFLTLFFRVFVPFLSLADFVSRDKNLQVADLQWLKLYLGGWKSLLRIEGVGKISYYHLLSKLQMIGVVDESLDRILAGHSVGRFEKR